MKVSDLIEQLQKLDGNLLVVTPDFDRCGHHPIELQVVELFLKKRVAKMLGDDEIYDEVEPSDRDSDVIKAVSL